MWLWLHAATNNGVGDPRIYISSQSWQPISLSHTIRQTPLDRIPASILLRQPERWGIFQRQIPIWYVGRYLRSAWKILVLKIPYFSVFFFQICENTLFENDVPNLEARGTPPGVWRPHRIGPHCSAQGPDRPFEGLERDYMNHFKGPERDYIDPWKANRRFVCYFQTLSFDAPWSI